MAHATPFYERFGVEECYIYDPDNPRLAGYLRRGGRLEEMAPAQMDGWVRPRLGIRFDLSGPELVIHGPAGRRFLTYVELAQMRDEAEAQLAEVERQRDAERDRAERLAARLRGLGIEPDA